MKRDMLLGDLVNGMYEGFLVTYGDSELALLATEVTLAEMIEAAESHESDESAAA